MITTRNVLVSFVLVFAAAAGACSSSGDDNAAPDTTAAASSTTEDTSPAPDPDDQDPSDQGHDEGDEGDGESDPTGTSAEALEALLPEAADLGSGVVAGEVEPSPEMIRVAMAEQCPGAEIVTETPEGTVGRAYRSPSGTELKVELLGGVEPMTAAEEDDLLAALESCHLVLESPDGLTHSVRFAAGPDDLGDQGVRGAVTDSISGAGLPEPVGINTYFVRVVVGDVAVLVRGSDGFDGTTLVEFNSDDAVTVATEMVARVEAL